MTLQDLLNADVGELGARLTQGFGWWTGELAGMVPDRWRRSGGAGRPIAELGSEGGPMRVWRRGRFTEVFERASPRPQVADVGLPPTAVLQRELSLPALGAADLKRLVALDLDRLTPFAPDQIYFDIELLDRDGQGGRRSVRLGVIPRADAEAALARARRHGIEPRRLGVIEDGAPRFDFLEAMRVAGRGGRPDRRLAYWWLSALALLAVNLAVLVIKDVNDVAALRGTVDLQRPTAALAARLRQRVEKESADRTALLVRRTRDEPLKIIDAVTRAFPAPQWVQRLEWNGQTLRLVGYRDPGFDVLSAVRGSPALGEPRQLNSTDAPAPGGKPSFDVIVEPSGKAGR